MKKYFSDLLLLLPLFAFSQGVIEGKIIDGEFNDILPFANIQLKQISPSESVDGTTSDFDGKFLFEELAEGQYELEVSFVGYNTKKITGINIAEDSQSQLFEITLDASSSELEEVVVTSSAKNNTANAVLNIQKRSAVLLDGLSLQTIRKAGDNDIASAIKRVPGISIEGGKYVYVRGLGDRYSKTTMNGMEVPGLDPDKNTLQLDIFPTNLIENIQVVKSASAKQDADFTGGIVNIELKDFANTPEYNFSFGISYNPKMHFQDNYIYDAPSKTDFLGYDYGDRKLRIARRASLPEPARDRPTTSLINNYTQLLDKNLEPITGTSFMNYNFGFSTSNSFELDNGKKFGYIGSINYRSNTTFLDDFLNSTYIFNQNGFSLNSQNDGLLGAEEKFVNVLTGVTYSGDNSKYKLNFLWIQNGVSNVRQGGFSEFVSDDFFGLGNFITYTQRTILSVPFAAKYNLDEGNSSLEIKANATKALVYDKDFKITVFEILDGDRYALSPNGAGLPQRIWRDLDEDVINAKVDYSTKFSINDSEVKLDVGAAYLFKNRVFGTDYYTINHIGSTLYLNGQANQLLQNDNLWTFEGGSGAYISGSFQEENQFDSDINKTSAYVSGEVNLNEKIKGIVGLRFENYKLIYTGQSLSQTVYEKAEFLNRSDFFPSLNLIYSLSDSKKVRASAYRTTARPSFKENSTAVILDPITGNRFYGNPNVTPSLIMNYDLRYENYGSKGEFFAISSFVKNFDDPIEIVLFDRSTPNVFIARNNPEATVVGAEFEARKNFIATDRNKLSLNVNLSVIESRQTMGPIERNIRQLRQPQGIAFKNYRQLQGQAPYIINTGVSFEDMEKNFEASLFFNRQGKTLQIVGNDDVPDVFSLPFNALNFTFEKKFAQENGVNRTLRIKIDNILNDQRESQYEFFDFETQPFSFRNFGTSFSLSYGIKF
ncbi:MAG: carboxypeptidase-like regulatory domain-containing protein [Flavobacteriaceae bacterium]